MNPRLLFFSHLFLSKIKRPHRNQLPGRQKNKHNENLPWFWKILLLYFNVSEHSCSHNGQNNNLLQKYSPFHARVFFSIKLLSAESCCQPRLTGDDILSVITLDNITIFPQKKVFNDLPNNNFVRGKFRQKIRIEILLVNQLQSKNLHVTLLNKLPNNLFKLLFPHP